MSVVLIKDTSRQDQLVVGEIRSLTFQMRRSNPVRRIAERVLPGETLREEEVSVLREILESARVRQWREQAIAAWLLGKVCPSSEETEKAVVTLTNVVENQQIS